MAAAERARSAVQGQLAHRQTVQAASGRSVPLRVQVFTIQVAEAVHLTVQPQQAVQVVQAVVVLAVQMVWQQAFLEQRTLAVVAEEADLVLLIRQVAVVQVLS